MQSDSHANDTAGDIERVLASFEHAAKPVQRCIGIAISNGFVQGRDEVVMLLASFVIQQNTFLQCVLNDIAGDLGFRFFAGAAERE